MENTQINRFTGINNRQPIDRIKPTDAGMPVRDAVNVDLSAAGTFQRRPGFAQVVTKTRCRDIFEHKDGALFASESSLFNFDGKVAAEVSPLASPFARVCYTDTPLGVVWSDGFSLKLLAGGSVKQLVPAKPNPEPAISIGSGSLVAGTYGVMFRSVRADGQQSAPTIPQHITVPANGAIVVSSAGHVDDIAVFVTAVDGEIFYREATIGVGQTSLSIPLVSSGGQPVRHEVISEIPPGKMLGLHYGRLLSVDGAFLFYSLPWAMGLHRPASDYIPLDEDITMIAPVTGGLYLSTVSATYWLAGGDVSKSNMNQITPYGAVKGTLTKVPNTTDLMWFSARGPVRATQDGQIALLQDDAIAYGVDTSAPGAAMFRETNGLRQFVAALAPKSNASSAVFGSFMDAEVIK